MSFVLSNLHMNKLSNYIVSTIKLLCNDTLSFITLLRAEFRAGLAGLKLGYPGNPALKPRKPG